MTLSAATDDTEMCGEPLSLIQTLLTLRQKPTDTTKMPETRVGFPPQARITEADDLKTRLKSVSNEMDILLGDGDVTAEFVRPSLPVALTEVNSGDVRNMPQAASWPTKEQVGSSAKNM